jgi:hypothetical protein
MSLKIKLVQDEHPEDPRKIFDHLGVMVCFHKRYNLGDKHNYKPSEFAGWKDLKLHLERVCDAAVCLPLYMYDRSGITISTQPFSCPWGSGQIGFIYVSRAKLLSEFGRKKLSPNLIDRAMQLLRVEVEDYNAYVSGDVWGYVLEDEAGNHVDSCFGYYGRKWAQEAAEEALKGLQP